MDAVKADSDVMVLTAAAVIVHEAGRPNVSRQCVWHEQRESRFDLVLCVSASVASSVWQSCHTENTDGVAAVAFWVWED